ncbi:MAG: undecaprenyl/decaprenyl-phosphate alpha-N-acetylglucosaminyl 1-phosphate transferase [Pseudomonadota bacterium]|nr:undecaprenyl/decaprenyl-phosphate alpha-N-acetylglucosaminyl 1-phosphate transferase [Pseudomonadota bacterium]
MAPTLGLVDVPGGRKVHGNAVPLVGGLAIFVTLLVAAWFLGVAPSAGYFLFALSIVIAVGCWDDVNDISPRLKFVIQIAASAIMIWGAGIQLHSVGDLLGWKPLGLWIFSIPLTIFAVVGVVNSVNMMDGLDGLGGSIALIAFAWYAAVAVDSDLDVQFKTALIFCGAIAGFLLFNLRFPWQPRARVFLGDAGSLMIGFALGWFAIDLTQGSNRTFPPIAALWVVLLPLADCVSLMLRRVRAGQSPFVADNRHIHHYLLRRGFKHGQTLAILVGLCVIFGAVGYFGWKAQLPEAALFWPFFFGFFAYHFWMKRAWESIDQVEPAGLARAEAQSD